jgi:hypothetical protein
MRVLNDRWDDVDLKELCNASIVLSVMYVKYKRKSRWIALEERIAAEWDNVPKYLVLEYAREGARGRLPEDLHNRMLMEATKTPRDKSVEEYFTMKMF